MSKIINWGILGLGRIAEKFAEGLAYVPNAKLYAVGSRSIDKAISFSQKYNATKAYGTYEEFVADKNIDVVYIATPHVHHCENTLLCLNNGKAVLCEKPFAINEKEVLKMVSKAKEKELFLMEGLWTRFLPTILKTIDLINSGIIGDIVHIKSDFGYPADFNPEWRLFNRNLGGGSLLDIGIYPVFLTLLLLGEPTEMISRAKIGITGIDETFSTIFKYKNGAMASLYSTLIGSSPVETDITGTKGRIRINRMWHMPTNMSYTLNNAPTEQINFNYRSNGYDIEAEEVTQCLIDGLKEHPQLPLDFSIKLIRILDQLRNECGIKYPADL